MMTDESGIPWLVAAIACAVLSASCAAPTPEPYVPAIAGTEAANVIFTDVTASAGIDFVHHNGRSGEKYLPETLGSGCAFIDYNNDGYLDIFLVNSKPWNAAGAEDPTSKLYHNNGDGTFADVTMEAGLASPLFGIGVAFGDVNNDGFDDLYITALDNDRLYRNRGDGTFEDVTSAAGIRNDAFATSAAFLDYDRDGDLDLFVDNYVQWSRADDLWCTLDGQSKTYCTPESYPGVPSKLYRNRGDGTFDDVSAAAGVADPSSKALGVAILDFDGDDWPDIFQANDTEPNKLYRNQQDGTFEDIGLRAGVAFAEDGKARGAMGVDAADYDGSGRPHLLVGNFSNEMVNLFHNEGADLFVDAAPTTAIGRASLLSLTFGAFFFDYNLDGRLDIFCANGHLDEEINNVQPKVTFAQSPQLFANLGDGAFEQTNRQVGEDFREPLVARGAAYGDYDDDGDLDLLITVNNGPAKLLRNDGGNAHSYLRVNLVGAKSNRNGFGAKLTLESSSGRQTTMARSGSSYASQSESTVTFGVADALVVDRLVIEWPSGETQSFEQVEPNRTIIVHETKGLLGTS